MFVVLLVLTLVLWFFSKNIYTKNIDVEALPKTTGTVVKSVLDNGITDYFVRFEKDGVEIEAETRSHEEIGRELYSGDVINMRYYVSSAGRVSVIIEEEGYELYGENFERKSKVLANITKICGILTIVTFLLNVISLFK